jgi:hypothetical protein
MEKLKCLGTTIIAFHYGENKSRFNSGTNFCYSVHNILSSHLLSKNVGNGIYKTMILSVVLHEFEIFSLILSREYRLRVSEKRVPK